MLAWTPVVLLLLLTGCTTLTPAQQESVEAAQRFLDQTSKAYGVQRVTLMLGSAGRGEAATIRAGGLVTMGYEYLTYPDVRDTILAHEMAHLILGHLNRHANSYDENQQREIDADIEAVEILQRVRGMTEPRAFSLVAAYALTLKKGVDSGSLAFRSGHPPPCRKVEALIKAYPRQQAMLDRLQGDPRLARCP